MSKSLNRQGASVAGPSGSLGSGKWKIVRTRSAFPGHMSGWLDDTERNVRYVWTSVNGKTSFLRLPKEATDIPAYVKTAIESLIEESQLRS